jgi:hypothetical protein
MSHVDVLRVILQLLIVVGLPLLFLYCISDDK